MAFWEGFARTDFFECFFDDDSPEELLCRLVPLGTWEGSDVTWIGKASPSQFFGSVAPCPNKNGAALPLLCVVGVTAAVARHILLVAGRRCNMVGRDTMGSTILLVGAVGRRNKAAAQGTVLEAVAGVVVLWEAAAAAAARAAVVVVATPVVVAENRCHRCRRTTVVLVGGANVKVVLVAKYRDFDSSCDWNSDSSGPPRTSEELLDEDMESCSRGTGGRSLRLGRSILPQGCTALRGECAYDGQEPCGCSGCCCAVTPFQVPPFFHYSIFRMEALLGGETKKKKCNITATTSSSSSWWSFRTSKGNRNDPSMHFFVESSALCTSLQLQT